MNTLSRHWMFWAVATLFCLSCGLIFAACDIDDDSYNPFGSCAHFCERLAECSPDTFSHYYGDVDECASDCEDIDGSDTMQCMIACADEADCIKVMTCVKGC
ncbi:MAG: hypothetical protein GX444_05330 [Myxococcales bacterium]|nr:hypothetical protein [Myxococcales bacterium]